MDPDFTILFLIFIGSILFALVLRFVQPELLYGLRQVLLEVQTNKIFLDHESGRLGLNPSFQELLVKDFRLESAESDSGASLKSGNSTDRSILAGPSPSSALQGGCNPMYVSWSLRRCWAALAGMPFPWLTTINPRSAAEEY